MKKILKRAVCGAAAALSILGIGSMPVMAERIFEDCERNCGVYDIEGVLQRGEYNDANEMVQQLSDDLDMYVAVYIVGPETYFYDDDAVESYADDCYDELFNPTDGVDTDGCLLLINDSTEYDYLSTSGMGQLYFYNGYEDDRTEAILEALTPSLKSKNYYAAIGLFCDYAKEYCEKGYPKNVYVRDRNSGEYRYDVNGQLTVSNRLPWGFGVNMTALTVISLLVGGLAAFLTAIIIKSNYRLVKGLASTNYISQNETKFSVREDHFLREYTTRTRTSESSGGGHGGGHSHMSSGGHSHGGGGHHR